MKKKNRMKTMKITKITIVVFLLFSTLSMIQANQYPVAANTFDFSTPGSDYYKPFTEQSNTPDLYSPSEIRLNDNITLFSPGSGSNGWVEMPYGEIENALKIPVGNGLGLLIMSLLGYAARIKFKKQSNKE